MQLCYKQKILFYCYKQYRIYFYILDSIILDRFGLEFRTLPLTKLGIRESFKEAEKRNQRNNNATEKSAENTMHSVQKYR